MGAHLPLQLSSLQTVGQIIAESILLRLSRQSLAIALFALPFGIFAVVNLPMGSAAVRPWLPEKSFERLRFETFTKNLGTDQMITALSLSQLVKLIASRNKSAQPLSGAA